MDVADETANAEHFGYPGASRGQSAFPQARVLGLVECGTHVVVAASIAPYKTSEVAMAAELLPLKLTGEMLVMADRNFYSFKLWQKTPKRQPKESRSSWMRALRPCAVRLLHWPSVLQCKRRRGLPPAFPAL